MALPPASVEAGFITASRQAYMYNPMVEI